MIAQHTEFENFLVAWQDGNRNQVHIHNRADVIICSPIQTNDGYYSTYSLMALPNKPYPHQLKTRVTLSQHAEKDWGMEHRSNLFQQFRIQCDNLFELWFFHILSFKYFQDFCYFVIHKKDMAMIWFQRCWNYADLRV